MKGLIYFAFCFQNRESSDSGAGNCIGEKRDRTVSEAVLKRRKVRTKPDQKGRKVRTKPDQKGRRIGEEKDLYGRSEKNTYKKRRTIIVRRGLRPQILLFIA